MSATQKQGSKVILDSQEKNIILESLIDEEVSQVASLMEICPKKETSWYYESLIELAKGTSSAPTQGYYDNHIRNISAIYRLKQNMNTISEINDFSEIEIINSALFSLCEKYIDENKDVDPVIKLKEKFENCIQIIWKKES